MNLKKVEEITISYIGFEVGLRGLSPKSIKQVYLGAISSWFVVNRVTNFFALASKQKLVKLVLEGFIKMYARKHPEAGHRKLAFTLELVKYLKPALISAKIQWNGHTVMAIELALKFGIYFLLRKSEFLPCGDQLGISWRQIKFYGADGFTIKFKEINEKSKMIKSMTINIEFSKTDQYGAGRVVSHVRTNMTSCIVTEVIKWAILCQQVYHVSEDGYLFALSDGMTFLKDNLVAKAMKAIVSYLGWKEDKVSVHSLRYGGATMLASAGLPQYLIEYYGGWAENSKSLRDTYIKIAAQGAERVSLIFGNGYNGSLEEARIRESEHVNH